MITEKFANEKTKGWELSLTVTIEKQHMKRESSGVSVPAHLMLVA